MVDEAERTREVLESMNLPNRSGEIQLRLSDSTGLPVYVRGAFRLQTRLGPEHHARLFLTRLYGPALAGTLTLEKELVDAIGYTHLRFAQWHSGIEVQGAEIWVHLDQEGVITSIGGSLIPRVRVDAEASIDHPEATALAQAALRAEVEAPKAAPIPAWAWDFTPKGEPELVVLPGITSPLDRPALAWRIHLGQWMAWVDAQSGLLLDRTLMGDTLDLETWSGDGSQSSGSLRGDTSPYYISDDIDEEEAEAHSYLVEYGSYLREAFGRESIDDNGLKLRQTVQYGTMSNAYWDGYGAYFGVGWATRDIVGHEFTHGLVDYTADLVYSNQPGGLNESFADIFAVMIDRDDWLQGEEASGFSTENPVRSLSDPHKGDRFHPEQTYNRDTNSGQPALYTELVTPSDLICGSTSDAYNGCVHFNSGIQNYVVYLSAEGGYVGDVLVVGLGRPRVEQVYYRSLAYHLTSSSSYEDARDGAIESCIELYGLYSPTCISIQNAWAAVGLGEPASIPVTVSQDGDGDYSTLQEALDGVTEGGTIRVLEGTYPASLSVTDRVLRIVGVGEVTLEGDGTSSLIALSEGTLFLSNLTLTGGGQGALTCSDATLSLENVTLHGNSAVDGGGISAANCEVSLSQSEVRDNQATGQGGGIFASGGSMNAIDFTISGNTAGGNGGGIAADVATCEAGSIIDNIAGGHGGGMYVDSATLEDLTVEGNEAGGDGGGVFSMSSLDAQSVQVSTNSAVEQGGGVFIAGAFTFVHSTVTSNQAASGGGIALGTEAAGELAAVEILDNSATTGGGVYVEMGSEELALHNLIVAGNQGTQGGGLALNDGALSLDYATFSENSADDGSALYGEAGTLTGKALILAYSTGDALGTGAEGAIFLSYSDTFQEGIAEGDGNIDADPSFVALTEDGSGVGDDLHLGEGSPSSDTGPIGESDSNGSRADMGAYGGSQGSRWPGEYTPCVTTVGMIEIGDSIAGSLSSTDATDGPRGSSYYHDSYVVYGESQEQVTIALDGEFDTYLYLLSPDCSIARSNDDSGSGFNSRIVYTFPDSGSYTVLATSYSGRDTGFYALSIE